jgi:hypothetical protein
MTLRNCIVKRAQPIGVLQHDIMTPGHKFANDFKIPGFASEVKTCLTSLVRSRTSNTLLQTSFATSTTIKHVL